MKDGSSGSTIAKLTPPRPSPPRTLTLVSEEALGRYPHASALKAALRSYAAARELVTPELEPLVAPQLRDVRESVAEAFESKSGKKKRVRWDGRNVSDWVTGLAEFVQRFEERVETLLRACERVEAALEQLGKVEYDAAALGGVVGNVQKVVDELSLAGYTELSAWVEVVDERMGTVLGRRLEGALSDWCDAFRIAPAAASSSNSDNNDGEEKKEDGVPTSASTKRQTLVPPILVEILLRNQKISASPAVPSVRSA